MILKKTGVFDPVGPHSWGCSALPRFRGGRRPPRLVPPPPHGTPNLYDSSDAHLSPATTLPARPHDYLAVPPPPHPIKPVHIRFVPPGAPQT